MSCGCTNNCSRTVTPTGAKGNTGNFSGLDAIVNAQSATQVLTAAQSGVKVILNRAAGVIVQLPDSAVGLNYSFDVVTSVTSNNYSITMTDASELFKGSVFKAVSGSAPTISEPNGTTNNAIVMNGTTTGGLVGTSFRVTCYVAGFWYVEGTTYGSGAVATPFSG